MSISLMRERGFFIVTISDVDEKYGTPNRVRIHYATLESAFEKINEALKPKIYDDNLQ